jgi:hypothetical protein
MKPREFYKIMEDFVKEDKRWRALKPGDAIYQEVPAALDFDYFKAIIVEVNLEDRCVLAIDKSDRINPDNEIVLESFITQEEFDKL